ncbi:STAS domain-containing protein [Candidatus Caldatribacterium sp. SIUC1]|uniref:STAS domain-containing protein n=1 Tax=Candidatus Caldatribacterium sp. SIUC1 TaxID=3418365 RepID=UPI003F68EB3F
MKRKVLATVQIGDCLFVPVHVELDDASIEALQQQLLEEIATQKVRALLLDLSLIEVIDSYASYIIHETAQMARLLGCKVVLVGIRPAVALTLAQMGIRFEHVLTALDLEHALEILASGGMPSDEKDLL